MQIKVSPPPPHTHTHPIPRCQCIWEATATGTFLHIALLITSKGPSSWQDCYQCGLKGLFSTYCRHGADFVNQLQQVHINNSTSWVWMDSIPPKCVRVCHSETTLGARGFLREEPRSGDKQNSEERRVRKHLVACDSLSLMWNPHNYIIFVG